MKTEFNSMSDGKKATVLEQLRTLNSTARMLLLTNTHSRQKIFTVRSGLSRK